jgi:uncharacterized protein (TIGR02757 family)
MTKSELKQFLETKVKNFNQPSFIKNDPICIPHLFSKQQDIEIMGFFAAIFAWGNRTTIINKCHELINRMDRSPHDFMLHHSDNDLKKLLGFKHRTFNDTDLLYAVSFFKYWYSNHTTLETAFSVTLKKSDPTVEHGLNGFRNLFFSLKDVPNRTKKHVASPVQNSACKRINMYLRWMVRTDKAGVDFGLWNQIKPSQLICPLDVHVQRVAIQLGLLQREQADWKAAMELTGNLKKLDNNDPVKYDFALFGLGVNHDL